MLRSVVHPHPNPLPLAGEGSKAAGARDSGAGNGESLNGGKQVRPAATAPQLRWLFRFPIPHSRFPAFQLLPLQGDIAAEAFDRDACVAAADGCVQRAAGTVLRLRHRAEVVADSAAEGASTGRLMVTSPLMVSASTRPLLPGLPRNEMSPDTELAENSR